MTGEVAQKLTQQRPSAFRPRGTSEFASQRRGPELMLFLPTLSARLHLSRQLPVDKIAIVRNCFLMARKDEDRGFIVQE
jgi:hypothetical protein